MNVFLPLSAALTLLMEGAAVYLIILASALLHELGHFICIKKYGAEIKRVDLEILGAVIVYSDEKTSLKQDFYINAAGAAVNLAVALAGTAVFAFFYDVYVLLAVFANLALAFINLLPVSNLDGGRALIPLLLEKYDVAEAERKAARISFCAKIFLASVSGLLVAASGFNKTMIILFLFNMTQIKD